MSFKHSGKSIMESTPDYLKLDDESLENQALIKD